VNIGGIISGLVKFYHQIDLEESPWFTNW